MTPGNLAYGATGTLAPLVTMVPTARAGLPASWPSEFIFPEPGNMLWGDWTLKCLGPGQFLLRRHVLPISRVRRNSLPGAKSTLTDLRRLL